MPDFKLSSKYKPSGDQAGAIAALEAGIRKRDDFQVLLGVTGSGKTFTIANVIERMNVPALVMAPNKTLAAQLFQEFKALFPENAVEYFVSYYDYYLPESYMPNSDTYIEKETSINEQIERMRHRATRSLMERRDCIIVASVSCIYGLGSPEFYGRMVLKLKTGDEVNRDELIARLVGLQYRREDMEFSRGSFRVRGECVDIFPSDEENTAYRLIFFGDEIEKIVSIDPLWGEERKELDNIAVFPSSHYVAEPEAFERALGTISQELDLRLKELAGEGKSAEAARLERRTRFDLEMLRETGFCSGIENYSRHFDDRAPGSPPATLINYFPDDFLLFIDESHISVPQIAGMFRGDRARKKNLVDYGFRLPCALDNRPLNFDEFRQIIRRTVFVSATPGPFEMEKSKGVLVEQLIRPTGLLDPEVEIEPVKDQVDRLMDMISRETARGGRTLVITLTKKMSEKLTDYLSGHSVKVQYIHSDVTTLERVHILRQLRRGDFDVLVGINLLREGIDLPEVSLVAILDADKEGFLRSETALIQIIGRAARNSCGRVVLFADKITGSMQRAMDETSRRREKQMAHNKKHNIEPRTIKKPLPLPLEQLYRLENAEPETAQAHTDEEFTNKTELRREIKKLHKQMALQARTFHFDEAARLRDRIKRLEELELKL